MKNKCKRPTTKSWAVAAAARGPLIWRKWHRITTARSLAGFVFVLRRRGAALAAFGRRPRSIRQRSRARSFQMCTRPDVPRFVYNRCVAAGEQADTQRFGKRPPPLWRCEEIKALGQWRISFIKLRARSHYQNSSPLSRMIYRSRSVTLLCMPILPTGSHTSSTLRHSHFFTFDGELTFTLVRDEGSEEWRNLAF